MLSIGRSLAEEIGRALFRKLRDTYPTPPLAT